MDLTRLPVVVGAGQHTNRVEDPLEAPDPFELMELVVGAAAADAGDPGLAAAATHVWVVNSLSLRHADPAGELARRLGAGQAEARYCGVGGAMPQWLVDRAAEMVVAGGRPLVVIAGAEALATRQRAKRAGTALDWPATEGRPETWPPQEADYGIHPLELQHGLPQPTHMYALIETAIAHALGHDPGRHLAHMAALMDRFNAVAAGNPLSWFPTRREAADLARVSADNRMICFPYPKYLNAVMNVDMAAAVIVTDAQTARDAGLDPGDVAHVAGWGDAKDVWYVSQRPELHTSPAIAECGRAALGGAGLALDDVTAFDIYSCFPSAVEVATAALGVPADDPRPLTLTGGLPYHGGPGNNYVTHALANMLTHVREHPDARVLVHGNGYFLTKQAVGVYTSQPPPAPPAPAAGLQDRVDAAARPVDLDPEPGGTARVVAYTVPHGRDGSPEPGIVLAQSGRGRCLALADEALTAALEGSDMVGGAVTVTAGAPTNAATLA